MRGCGSSQPRGGVLREHGHAVTLRARGRELQPRSHHPEEEPVLRLGGGRQSGTVRGYRGAPGVGCEPSEDSVPELPWAPAVGPPAGGLPGPPQLLQDWGCMWGAPAPCPALTGQQQKPCTTVQDKRVPELARMVHEVTPGPPGPAELPRAVVTLLAPTLCKAPGPRGSMSPMPGVQLGCLTW